MNTTTIKRLISQNKTLSKSKTSAELLVRALAFLYTKAEKRTDAFFLAHGITAAQYNVLALLVEEDDGINQLSISRRMLVSQGNITRILDKLVRAELIKRVEDAADRRHKRISITAKGRKLHSEIKPAYDKLIHTLPAKLAENVQKRTAYALIEWAYQLDEESL
ncbi:MarR family transcriptional regulator [Candidatus Avelusimicrobium fimicolum]|uniref:MarR family winged helix-turn-helix transcriptional regulator n=1 Tax=Candidatus Avelusimicrobium fimicolum TaxID=3416216 RepID=UPI0015AD5BC2